MTYKKYWLDAVDEGIDSSKRISNALENEA